MGKQLAKAIVPELSDDKGTSDYDSTTAGLTASIGESHSSGFIRHQYILALSTDGAITFLAEGSGEGREGVERGVQGQCLGIIVSGESVIGVHLNCGQDTPQLVNQFTWKLQRGDRVDAYCRMCERVGNYVSNEDIREVIVKASAVGPAGLGLSHLQSAELRGVVCVAARMEGARVSLVQKSQISRTFGSKKVDEYTADDTYWEHAISGDITRSRREAALLILSQRDES